MIVAAVVGGRRRIIAGRAGSVAAMAADIRVCPSDGGDHEWGNRSGGIACGRGGKSWRITTATCGKCGTLRTVFDGPDGRTVEDVPARSAEGR